MIRLLVLLLLVPFSLVAQDTVRFNPTVQQPTFAVREPVLRVRAGTVLVSKTHFGPYYSEAGGVHGRGEDLEAIPALVSFTQRLDRPK